MLSKPNTQRITASVFVLYAVEFLDEFIYSLHGAVLPTLKSELALTYTQVGLLLSLPNLVGVFAEPIIGLIGDTRYRRWLVMAGIVATFTLGLSTAIWMLALDPVALLIGLPRER